MKVSRILWLAAAGFLIAAAALFLQQLRAYRQESDMMQARLEQAEALATRTRTAGARREELARAQDEVRGRVADARRLMPPELGTEEFAESLLAAARAAGVTARKDEAKEMQNEFYASALVTFTLAVDAGEAHEIIASVDDAEKRFVKWKAEEAGEKSMRLTAEIYSVPHGPGGRGAEALLESVCAGAERRVWLWPLAGRLARLDDALGERCRFLEENRAALEALEQLDASRREAEVIDGILAETGAGRRLP